MEEERESEWYELQVIMTSYYFYNLTHLVNESKYAQHLHLHHSSPATQEGGVQLKERVVAKQTAFTASRVQGTTPQINAHNVFKKNSMAGNGIFKTRGQRRIEYRFWWWWWCCLCSTRSGFTRTVLRIWATFDRIRIRLRGPNQDP